MTTKNAINHFFADPDYAALVDLDREQRLLFITDLSETRVSAFLAWVFRPYEGHGLGDRAVRDLLQRVWEANETEGLTLDVMTPAKIRASSFQDLLVYKEYRVTGNSKKVGSKTAASKVKVKPKKPKTGSVDLLLISRANKLLIAIENKFGSRLHSNQLTTYRKYFDKHFRDLTKIYVYLDWNENELTDTHWCPLNYQWIVDLISSQQAAGLLSEKALDALTQVKDYINDEAPISSNATQLRDRRIESLGSKHAGVLSVIEQWRKVPVQMLVGSNQGINAPLLVEYLQRRRLLNDVLDQRVHADLIVKVRKELGDAVDIGSGTSAVYFRMRSWDRLEIKDADYWSMRVVAWCGKVQSTSYSVQAGCLFSSVRPDLASEMRKAVVSMRDAQLNAPKPNANWVTVGRQEHLKTVEAADTVVRVLKGIDACLEQIKGK